MSLTPSTMVQLGTRAPDFELLDVAAQKKQVLSALKGERGSVIVFMCNHCPFVKHIEKQLARVADEYLKKGIAFIGISANDVETHPDDAPEKLAEQADRAGFHFPYLYDESQNVARAYNAVCTPDFFVFNAELQLIYRGQFDETRPGSGHAHGRQLTEALDNLLAGNPPLEDQQPSIGCNIKWK